MESHKLITSPSNQESASVETVEKENSSQTPEITHWQNAGHSFVSTAKSSESINLGRFFRQS